MGTFGKKNKVKSNIYDFNIGIIGESGIGKTTLIKEVCEKLVGEDGYMVLNIGKEDGVDAINGVVYEDAPDWDSFANICDDIIEKKDEEYPCLKIVCLDTIDQLFEITEPEVIRMHNIENRNKKDFIRCTSIKAAFGGFMAGEDKAIEIILEKLWELKKAGVHFMLVGHTKKRDIEDAVTGKTYSTLTTNISQRYFNALKTKLHVLGVAYIDRSIVGEKTGKKNAVTKEEEIKGKVISESRKIAFRDDNYSIDSKSRFSDIASEIPLDADAFIKAIQDAIEAAKNKDNIDVAIVDEVVPSVQEEPTENESKKCTGNGLGTSEEETLDLLVKEIRTSFKIASKEDKIRAKDVFDGTPLSKITDTKILKKALKILNA